MSMSLKRTTVYVDERDLAVIKKDAGTGDLAPAPPTKPREWTLGRGGHYIRSISVRSMSTWKGTVSFRWSWWMPVTTYAMVVVSSS